MPKLEIRGNASDVFWILAVATFPKDAKLRKYYYAIKHAEQELAESHAKGFAEVENQYLRDLLDAPSRGDMKSRAETAAKAGMTAGYFLLGVFGMELFPERFPEPSGRKAIALAQAFAKGKKFGKDSSGKKTALFEGETTITKHFKEFSSVAHLWAAMLLLQEIVGRQVFASSAAIKVYLEVARTFQEFGCRFVPKRVAKLARAPKPLLDSKKVWNVQASARDLAQIWKVPPKWMLAAANKYKARTSTYLDPD